jgi:TRAP-type mannitol/chloroaromatic compound transport system permease small subunit
MHLLFAKLARTCQLIDTFSEWIGRTVAWLTLLMVLITFLVVILRYAFSTGWIAMQESITYLYALVFLLGSAYTLKHDGHVRVDIFYRTMHPKTKALVNLCGTLLLLLPTCVFFFWVSWDYVADSWSVRESSREAGNRHLGHDSTSLSARHFGPAAQRANSVCRNATPGRISHGMDGIGHVSRRLWAPTFRLSRRSHLGWYRLTVRFSRQSYRSI